MMENYYCTQRVGPTKTATWWNVIRYITNTHFFLTTAALYKYSKVSDLVRNFV